MTLKDQMQYMGKKATIHVGGLKIQVIITDYKTSYGKDRWLVKPVSGSGEVWIESVTLE